MNKELNKRIAQLRAATGLTAEEFCKKTPGCNYSALSKIETFQRSAGTKVIRAICEKWGVAEEWVKQGKGKLVIQERPDLISANVYKDALVKELKDQNEDLKEDKQYWKQQYDKVFNMLAAALPLGKLKSLVPAGFFKKKESRTGARV